MSISKLLKSLSPKNKKRLLLIYEIFHKINMELTIISPINIIKIHRAKKKGNLKLNIGCGKAKIANWVNIDIEPNADLIIDVSRGMPFLNESVDLIYNEHFIEHLNRTDGEKTLKEFNRILKERGVLRIATPDLDYILKKYNSDWQNQDWLTWPGFRFIKTRGQMLNISFRCWGHKYLYNEEDLKILLKNAGFRCINQCEYGKSKYPELSDLETRKDSKLILEAIK